MKKEKNRIRIRHLMTLALVLVPAMLCVAIFAFLMPDSSDEKNLGVVYAKDLMSGIEADKSVSAADGKKPDALFKEKYLDFALSLFKETLSENDENARVMVSPLSIYYALAMTANGADEGTKEEFEQILGLETDELNEYMLTYAKMLKTDDNDGKAVFNIANSIWFKNDVNLHVNNKFLQTNANYYAAEVYKTDFDKETVRDINAWVNEKTNEMIDKIIQKIDKNELMYLVNAVLFESEWKKQYMDIQVKEGSFTNAAGKLESVEYMQTTLDRYMKADNAVGFLKEYEGDFAFAAILPAEGMLPEEYIKTLTAEKWMELLASNNYNTGIVHTAIPKFKSENTFSLTDVLKKMGMTEAFSATMANFSRMGSYINNLYIGGILQKTYIEVNEKGTKAAAVTAVKEYAGARPTDMEIVEIYLDRPFVYAIIDTNTNLPLFIGTVSAVN